MIFCWCCWVLFDAERWQFDSCCGSPWSNLHRGRGRQPRSSVAWRWEGGVLSPFNLTTRSFLDRCVYVVVWWTSVPSCDDHVHRHSPVPKCKANNYCEIKTQHITFGLPGPTWRTKSPATNCSLQRRSMHRGAPGCGYHCWRVKRTWWFFVWCTLDDLKRIGRMQSMTHITKLNGQK